MKPKANAKPVTVHIGMGSNQGDRVRFLRRALLWLAAHRAIAVRRWSRIYETEYVGDGEQDPYLNACLTLETSLAPRALLAVLKVIETREGRRPGGKWAPRPIDLDILLYGHLVSDEPGLVLPHPELRNRAFVLAPLADIAPEAILPDSGETIADVCAKIRRKQGPWIRVFAAAHCCRSVRKLTRRTGVLPWRYIVVEGVIGVGKTSLTKLLATRTSGRVNLEVVEENPFLTKFYRDRSAYAFQTQIFFLLSRFRQQQSLFQHDLFSATMISDYLFAKDRIFANLNLSDDELALYSQLATILEQRVLKPDLVIYLQARTEVLLQRIKWRGRAYEQDMDARYLDALNGAYSYFFHHYQDTPLLVVNTDNLDFVNVPRDFDLLHEHIQTPFTGTRYFAPDTRPE